MPPSSARALFQGASKFTTTTTYRRSASSHAFYKAAPGEQAFPIGPFYEAILASGKPQPIIPDVKPEEPPQSSPKAPRSTTTKKTAAARKKESQPVSADANTSTSTPQKPAAAAAGKQ